MTWSWKAHTLRQRLLVGLLFVAAAIAFRAVVFGELGRGIPYLLFFPAVTLAALYGGLTAGLLATALSTALTFFWVLRSELSPVEYLALAIFAISSTLISFVCERMLRANAKTKLAEAALRETNEYLDNLLNYANAPIIVWDSSFKITRFNHAFEALTGRAAGEVIGKTLELLFPSALVESSMARIKQATGGERWDAVEIGIVHVDGSIRTVLWNSATLFEADGKTPLATIAQGQDITAREQANAALNASEIRYRRLFETTKDGILTLDAETGMVMEVNPFLIELLGFSREAFLGKKVWELGFFKDIVANQDNFAELQAKEYIRYEDMALETSDGRRIEVEFTSSVYLVNHQKVIQCNIRDISERKATEEKQRASDLRYRRLFESTKDGILILDGETGMVMDANPLLIELLGFSHAEFLGKKIWELGFFKDIVANQENFAELQRKEYIRYEDMALETSTGRRIEVEFTSNLYRVNNKKVIQCDIRDISERKQAERALQESEDRFRTMTNSMSQLAWIARADGFIFWYNQRWFEYTGTTPAQMEGRGWQSVHDPVWLPRVMESWTGAIAAGQPFEMEFPLRGADGQFRAFLSRGQPLKDSAGRVMQWFGTNTDVEALKQSEEQIRQLNAELEQRVTELEAANNELESFSYSVSHDLRAPLRAVNGFAKIVLDTYAPQLPAEAREYLEDIRTGGEQMGQLIDDLLAFSRLGRQALKSQPVDTARLVQTVLDDLAPQREGRPFEIKVGELPGCQGDPALLKQVWVNLLGNALKYTRGRTPAVIEIGSDHSATEAVFFVRDNGAGFDMRYVHKLFGIFQRLHRADEFEGTGVGLAIVQRIIHRHGGRLWAEAELGRGATFHFTLGTGGINYEPNRNPAR